MIALLTLLPIIAFADEDFVFDFLNRKDGPAAIYEKVERKYEDGSGGQDAYVILSGDTFIYFAMSGDYYQITSNPAKENARAVATISKRTRRHLGLQGYCTAFLVAADTAITAGHCTNIESYRNQARPVAPAHPAPGTTP